MGFGGQGSNGALMLCVLASLTTILEFAASTEPIQFRKTSSTSHTNSHTTFHQALSGGRAVDCVDGSTCQDGQTCCPFFSNGTYGCCAGDQNTCCSLSVGRDTCCPRDSKCCRGSGCCGNGADCCDDGGCCQPNQECCGDYCCNSALGVQCCPWKGCCPGDCCPDQSCCGPRELCCADFCCPTGYTCCDQTNYKGCCYGDAVCCDNGICCPAGTRCCGINQCCQLDLLRDIIVPAWTYPASMIKHDKK